MEKAKKSVKRNCFIIYSVILIMIGTLCSALINIVKFAGKDVSAFEINLSRGNFYCLYIDGKDYDIVDYNTYGNLDRNGNTNAKMCIISQNVGTATRSLMITILFISVYQMLHGIVQEGTPFTKKNVSRLRLISVIMMLTAIIPGFSTQLLRMTIFPVQHLQLSQLNFLVLILGILFGVISEVFKYGYRLQEDADQIA